MLFNFQKISRKRSDYLKTNDLQESHEGKSTAYLFPLRYCGHRWFANGQAIKLIDDIQPYLSNILNILLKTKSLKKLEFTPYKAEQSP